MRRPPGHLITGAGRGEVLRKGAGEEKFLVVLLQLKKVE